MERSENDPSPAENSDGTVTNHYVWLHLSSQLIYFVLFQFACFPEFLTAIHDRVWKSFELSFAVYLDEFIAYYACQK